MRASERHPYDWPEFDSVLEATMRSINALEETLDPEQRARVAGLGVAVPTRLWTRSDEGDVPADHVHAWRERDFATELDAVCPYKVHEVSESAAPCAAELVFGGHRDLPATFLHVFLGYFVGGGLVIDNRVFIGPTGHAGDIGAVPIAQPDGSTQRLSEVASLNRLGRRVIESGKELEPFLALPLDWALIEGEIEDWLLDVIPALSQAVVTAASLIDVEAVMIDGHMPDDLRDRLVQRVAERVETADFSGYARPKIHAGTMGPAARSMGAASLPLAARFLV